jgi:DNA-binding NarL/FixJ family response regulator
MQETTVLIVEPNIDIQSRYRQHLIHDPTIRLIGVCSSMNSALSMLNQVPCELLFTELDLPDGSGMDLIQKAFKDFRVQTCVVISTSTAPGDITKCIELGADGYIIKNEIKSENLANYVRTIRAGGSPVSPMAARVLIKNLQSGTKHFQSLGNTFAVSEENNPLSPRETEILRLLAKGMSFAQIASVLMISSHTVTTHIKKIYRKLQVHSRGEAVYEAALMGLLGPRNS